VVRWGRAGPRGPRGCDPYALLPPSLTSNREENFARALASNTPPRRAAPRAGRMSVFFGVTFGFVDI
jgi:hypothetical protein